MAVRKTTTERSIIDIQKIEMAQVCFNFLGTSPMIMHRFSQKAWRELLLPSIRENRQGLEQKLKHDPMAEYRGAFYRNREPKSKTLFHIPNGAFHAAISDCALDIPGPKKAQLERLTQVVDVTIELYGVPQIFCAMVRNSDIGRTPDVRTRPIFPQWGGRLTVSYMRTVLTERSVTHLAGAAGELRGIGDWRPQRGGPYGRFKLVTERDAEWLALLKTQGRKAQQSAFETPAYYDTDTEELLLWFSEAVKQREMEGQLKTDWELEPKDGVRSIIEQGGNGRGEDADYVGVEQ